MMNVPLNKIKKLNIFIHLSTGQDAEEWNEKWKENKLIGINDPYPYGYQRASDMGCNVIFSKNYCKNYFCKFMKIFLRVLLGFDYIHARNNKNEIYKADVVWTHTETQFLGICLLFLLNGQKKRPKLIGQSVWLIDKWHKLLPVHRWFYRKLLNEVDLLTFHSSVNSTRAKQLFPNIKIEQVLFGIPSDDANEIIIKNSNPIKVLSLGNDKHRDWDYLIKALGNQQNIEVLIISQKLKAKSVAAYSNIKVVKVTHNDELITHFKHSSVMLVPLKPNMHASGITVIQEAALMGLPIIATDTGGLKDYFDETCIKYVNASDAADILNAVQMLGKDTDTMTKFAKNAQARMKSSEMGCDAYIKRHVLLSHELLSA